MISTISVPNMLTSLPLMHMHCGFLDVAEKLVPRHLGFPHPNKTRGKRGLKFSKIDDFVKNQVVYIVGGLDWFVASTTSMVLVVIEFFCPTYQTIINAAR